jgi:hypothetical protein
MWQKPGFPPRHDDEVRRASRAAWWAVGGTALVAAVLLGGTLYWHVPPAMAAVGGAVFLAFGLLGGLGGLYDTRVHVRLIPYFRAPVGQIDTFTAGRALARYLSQLDKLAVDHGWKPISAFGFNDDLRGESLIWHDAADGLQTVTGLLRILENSASDEPVPPELLEDLRRWAVALQRASAAKIPFCVLLLHGNVTSGHEWSVRQGTAV